MGFERDRRNARRASVGLLALVVVAVAGCAVAEATPTPGADRTKEPVMILSLPPETPTATATPTIPICQDGPNAPSPRPSICRVPTPPPTPTRTPSRTQAAIPSQTAYPTMPPSAAWHGRTIYRPAPGTGLALLGVGPDDTVYAMLSSAIKSPAPTPTGLAFPDVRLSVIALRTDGSPKPGWPAAGVAVSGFPMSWTMSRDGTVFVATVAQGRAAMSGGLAQLTITAIGTDGRVLSGWPYRSPAAQQRLDWSLLVAGPDHTVCFPQVKAGVISQGTNTPYQLYCVGPDGRLLPGWPYTSPLALMHPAVGPDGTVYVEEITSVDQSRGLGAFPYAFPFRVIALRRDGKPRPDWKPWARADNQGLMRIVPTSDGNVFVLIGGDAGRAQLVMLDRTGKPLIDRNETSMGLRWPNYKAAFVTDDDQLYVSMSQDGGADCVEAYDATGSALPGWPAIIGGWAELTVSRDGNVWAVWETFGAGNSDTSVVALFDTSGHLQPGYPMAADKLAPGFGLELSTDSAGRAYTVRYAAGGSELVVLDP